MMQAPQLIELPTDSTPVHVAAEMYARHGFMVTPVYGVEANGRCMCGNADCEAQGKHPVGNTWQKRATADLDAVRDLFRGHRGNIGLVLGAAFIAIDVDEYAGGLDGLAELGDMPLTLTSRSGSGQGEHRVFAFGPGQDPAAVSNRKVATGVDVKTRGGQIVVAPSLHRSGKRYAWTVCMPPAPLSDAIYEKIRKRSPAVVVAIHSSPNSELRKRAEAYAAKLEPAIAGAGGHNTTFLAARSIAGWVAKGLPEHDGWSLFVEYNTRCQPPWAEPDLRHKWKDALGANTLPQFEDRQRQSYSAPSGAAPPSGPQAPALDWKARLIWQPTKGPDKPAQHHENAIVVLKYHPAWQGRVKLDVHAQRVTVTEPPWHESNRPAVADQIREWTDADSVRLSSWIRREVFALDLTVSDVDRAVGVAAEADTYHPFRDYLDGLVWDQTPRLSSWLTTYLGVEPTDYSALVGRWWMVAAVARTYDPGCKVDNVLILEGAQGIKKSAALRTLASPRWFTDTPIDIGSKDAYLALQGRVIVELAELDSLKRADADRAKTFFSSPVDVYRPPYARRNISVPRGCVFAGTVNHAQYLQDDTGNRRYWPVRCSRVDLEALGLDRSQLWAEAVWLYREGFRWWPDSPAEAMLCEVEQAPRGESDAWEDIVSRWVDGHPDTSTADILGGPLKIETGKWSKADQQRVGRVLVGLGLERYRRRDGESLTWRYRVDKQRKQRNSSQG